MDLYKLKTFRTVGVFLNFNKAADVLNCAQSTISAQIKSLEEEIGELLFKRIKKEGRINRGWRKVLDSVSSETGQFNDFSLAPRNLN